MLTHVSAVLRETAQVFKDADAPLYAAALAHFAIIAIIPFIMVGVGFMESVPSEAAHRITEHGTTEAYESFARPVRAFLPFIEETTAQAVREVVEDHHWRGLVGYAALLATVGIFGWALKRALRRVLPDVEDRGFFRERVGVYIFLMVAILVAGASGVAWNLLDAVLGATARDAVFSTFALTVGFVTPVKWLGRKTLAWRSLAGGALVFVSLWQLAMFLFANLVVTPRFSETYGTLGGIACAMLWLYYAALIYLACTCLVGVIDKRRVHSAP